MTDTRLEAKGDFKEEGGSLQQQRWGRSGRKPGMSGAPAAEARRAGSVPEAPKGGEEAGGVCVCGGGEALWQQSQSWGC